MACFLYRLFADEAYSSQTEATFIVCDASESMQFEFRAPAEHTDVDDAVIETYASTELFVRALPFTATEKDILALFERELNFWDGGQPDSSGIKSLHLNRVGRDDRRKQGTFAGHLSLAMTTVAKAQQALATTVVPIPIADFAEIAQLRLMLEALGLDSFFHALVNNRWDYACSQTASDEDWQELGMSLAEAASVRESWKPPPRKGRTFNLQFLPSKRIGKAGGKGKTGKGKRKGKGAGGRGCAHCGSQHKASACPFSPQNQRQTTRMRVVQDGFQVWSKYSQLMLFSNANEPIRLPADVVSNANEPIRLPADVVSRANLHIFVLDHAQALSARIMNLLQPLSLGLLTFVSVAIMDLYSARTCTALPFVIPTFFSHLAVAAGRHCHSAVRADGCAGRFQWRS